MARPYAVSVERISFKNQMPRDTLWPSIVDFNSKLTAIYVAKFLRINLH